MVKTKKTVPPATDTEIKPDVQPSPATEEDTQAALEAQPKTEVPLSLEVLAEKQAAFEKEVEKGFNSLIERLGPIIQLSDRIAQQQTQQPTQENQPQQASNMMGGIGQLLPLISSIMGAGAGGDDAFKKMAMDSMMEEIKFSRTFRQLFLSKFAGESLSSMVKTATEG